MFCQWSGTALLLLNLVEFPMKEEKDRLVLEMAGTGQTERADTGGILTLAIDTSSAMLSLALSRDGAIIASLVLTEVRQHSQVVFEQIQALTLLARIRADEIDLFAAVTGPGSFTGLRIGLAAIEGMAAALEKPVVGVTTFDASARAVQISDPIVILVDAGRGDVFMGIRRLDSSALPHLIGQDFVGSLDDALRLAHRAVPDAGAWITGSACSRYHGQILAAAERLELELSTSAGASRERAGWHLDDRRAALAPATAALATSAYLSGGYPGLKPYYLKPSDAEAKWKSLASQT
jgi:tRNA threonylcarbamoyladenosine biosynthesis protein TsaB